MNVNELVVLQGEQVSIENDNLNYLVALLTQC